MEGTVKLIFPIFKSVKDVQSKTLQNNQLKIKENQNQCGKTVELSLEIRIVKTATNPYDVATYRPKSLERLKTFRNVSFLIELTSLLKTVKKLPFRIVSGSRRKFNSNG